MRLAALLDGVLCDLEAHAAPAVIGSRLHATVAAIVIETCRAARRDTGLSTVALSGGVFQNRLLFRKTVAQLESAGFEVYTHHQVPCNDGGISLGQAAIANFAPGKS